jgi:hypothetical protein
MNHQTERFTGFLWIIILFLFIGTWLLASAIMILSFNLLGISISIVVNNILIALIAGFVDALLWGLLMYFSMSVIEILLHCQQKTPVK